MTEQPTLPLSDAAPSGDATAASPPPAPVAPTPETEAASTEENAGQNEPAEFSEERLFIHLNQMVDTKVRKAQAVDDYIECEDTLFAIGEGMEKSPLPEIPEGKSAKQKTLTNTAKTEKFTVKKSQAIANKIEDKQALIDAVKALTPEQQALIGDVVKTGYVVTMTAAQFDWLTETYPGTFAGEPMTKLDNKAYEDLEDNLGATGLQWASWLSNFIERIPGKIGWAIERKEIKAKATK